MASHAHAATMTLTEVPFLHRHPPLPLPGAGAGEGATTVENAPRRIVASLGRANDGDGSASGARGASHGVVLTERSGGREGLSSATAIVEAGDATNVKALVSHGDNTATNNNNGNNYGAATDPQEETHSLRGLSSTHHVGDGRVVFASGVADMRGVIRISLRTYGENGEDDNKANKADAMEEMDTSHAPACEDVDVDVDLSPLSHGPVPFVSPAVGAACYVSPGESEGSVLHLRAVDVYGTVLSLALSYPSLQPLTDCSFLLPLSPGGSSGGSGLYPHPGASLEGHQVCFPTATTVVFALNPHLYCVDLGGNALSAVTRVWTNVHRVTSDPLVDVSDAAPTPKKKARKSLGGVLSAAASTLLGLGTGAEYEYDDGGNDEGGGGTLPSIAALANLADGADTDHARVATLHSDGSLRIWTAIPSANDTSKGRLRIPSVQRVAVSHKGGGWTGSQLGDVPLPRASAWDPSRDALTLRGRYVGGMYEVAVHVRCHAGLRDNEDGGGLYVVKGDVLSADADEESGEAAEVQRLSLPGGTEAVVDVAWSGDGALVALLRRDGGDDEGLYDVVEVEEATTLALYPLDRRGKSYSKEPVVPSTMTLAHLGLNHPEALRPSAEEELGRYLGSNGPEDEAAIDRAGLLAILQPFGRCRPSALAVHRALSTLGLLDGDVAPADIRPATVLLAVRKWKARASFPSSSTSVVPVDDVADQGDGGRASPTATGTSIYHAFASATKAARGEDDDDDVGEKGTEPPEEAHRSRWVRLVAELRRQEARLDAALRLAMPSPSTGTNFLVRGSMVSVVTLDSSDSERGGKMAALDELAVDLLERAASDPELRHLLSHAEAALYDAAATASCLVDGWSTQGLGFGLMSRVELLGRSAAAGMEMSDDRLRLMQELARSDSWATSWLAAQVSESPSVARRLALPRTLGPIAGSGDGSDMLRSASSILSSQLECSSRLALARLLLVAGAPGGNPPSVLQSAMSFALYSTALSWAIHQTSSVEKRKTILEHHASNELMSPSGGALRLDRFSPSAMAPPSSEPRVALRLVAPLVEFSPQMADVALWGTVNDRREAVAECLLVEAASIAHHAGGSVDGTTAPDALWGLASKLLLGETTMASLEELTHRVKTLERHLTNMESSETALPLCCSVVLDAVQDTLFGEVSIPPDAEDGLRAIAFSTAMRGCLWDEALRYCILNPDAAGKKAGLKRLILTMVDASAVGKLVDMSLSIVGDAGGGVDLFSLAASIVEEAAIEQSSEEVGELTVDRPNYWGCLYTLHASRGNWRQAAYAMDMCGKATVDVVSKFTGSLSKSASKKIMDDACSSAQACVHAISQVEDPSRRYLLPGKSGDGTPSESRLLTQEDLERRAIRAQALRAFSMDEYSPDSIATILQSTSRDTIDCLARLGYYDQAIAVASGVSSKRNGLPGGVDLFDDALKYILGSYLVPAATSSLAADGNGGVNENLQSRSKIAQIRVSSSACALHGSVNASSSQPTVTSHSVNTKSWVSNSQSERTLQSAMAMGMLQQYTTVYSKKCSGLALHVADAVLRAGGGTAKLPLWLKQLCMHGAPGEEGSRDGLFAQTGGVADPAGLMRLYIKHHQYGEACDVVTSILSQPESNTSSRLPEKGSIDYVPYDLIDMLWSMIESIVASNPSNSSVDIKAQVKSLINSRKGMETALERHFEALKISEEGIKSARTLMCA